MSQGEYRLLRIVQGRTAFARVVLEAHEDGANGPLVVDASSVEEPWRGAVVFGVIYAQEQLSFAGDHRKWRVVARSLDATVVDTTVMAVAFASYHAACLAFGMRPDERIRLRADSVFELPAFTRPA